MSSRCNWSRKRACRLAATRERPRRVDYEYERAGTAAVFLFSEPLAGLAAGRRARDRRTKADWAVEGRRPVGRALRPTARRSPWCATTSTRTRRALLYEAFEPSRARELVRRIEFC